VNDVCGLLARRAIIGLDKLPRSFARKKKKNESLEGETEKLQKNHWRMMARLKWKMLPWRILRTLTRCLMQVDFLNNDNCSHDVCINRFCVVGLLWMLNFERKLGHLYGT
jgi:hypothetical protein